MENLVQKKKNENAYLQEYNSLKNAWTHMHLYDVYTRRVKLILTLHRGSIWTLFSLKSIQRFSQQLHFFIIHQFVQKRHTSYPRENTIVSLIRLVIETYTTLVLCNPLSNTAVSEQPENLPTANYFLFVQELNHEIRLHSFRILISFSPEYVYPFIHAILVERHKRDQRDAVCDEKNPWFFLNEEKLHRSINNSVGSSQKLIFQLFRYLIFNEKQDRKPFISFKWKDFAKLLKKFSPFYMGPTSTMTKISQE